MYVCTYTLMLGFVGSWVHMHIVHVCVEARLCQVSFSIVLHLIKGTRISHLNSELAGSARLARQLALTHPGFGFPSTGISGRLSLPPRVTWCWESELRSSYLDGKCFTH